MEKKFLKCIMNKNCQKKFRVEKKSREKARN